MKNENILCVDLCDMRRSFDMSLTAWPITSEAINALSYKYHQRKDAESDFSLKQLIPYAIVVDSNKRILCYQRAGSEQRLKGIWSAGIGGHVNDQDLGDTLSDRLICGLMREFQEEIGVSLSQECFTLMGMINEEDTEVGHCHTGVVFKVNLPDGDMCFDAEISNPHWFSASEIDYSKFEMWSALAIKLVNNE